MTVSGEFHASFCTCGHQVLRDHKRTMHGELFCYLCPDGSRCEAKDSASSERES